MNARTEATVRPFIDLFLMISNPAGSVLQRFSRGFFDVPERSRAQLGLYALALERITGIPVKQRALCLIGQGKTLEV